MRKKLSKTYQKHSARMRRVKTIQKRIYGTEDVPRLSVFRSAKNISGQIINDDAGKTLVSMSTLAKGLDIDQKMKRTEKSFEIGKKLGEKAIAAGITKVCFDRAGFLFHGRVKAFADGARKAGLEF
ncbi:MAG: 50S ribosomal protein L18 [Candidatus Cloacimonetes bacterium]|nr:50S ribosomal protein L18 [Candidatus Cloacimonadota bacterium]